MRDRCFLTGCDVNTEWMLPWFLKNYFKHNKTPIVFADFGVSDATRAWVYQVSGVQDTFEVAKQLKGGWFYKPQAMYSAKYKEVCWLDTDIQILGDMSSIFDHLEDNKLGMIEDKPWSKQSGEKWHNSGVVAMRDKPIILGEWIDACKQTKDRGDQEVLHTILNQSPMKRLSHITDLPNKYNWLRLQIERGDDSSEKLAMHWTGFKGKDMIRKLMYNE